jgi:hypothetical protein
MFDAPDLGRRKRWCSESSTCGYSEKVPAATGIVWKNDRVEGAIGGKTNQKRGKLSELLDALKEGCLPRTAARVHRNLGELLLAESAVVLGGCYFVDLGAEPADLGCSAVIEFWNVGFDVQQGSSIHDVYAFNVKEVAFDF